MYLFLGLTASLSIWYAFLPQDLVSHLVLCADSDNPAD